jgi:Tol biopolymer transport system component
MHRQWVSGLLLAGTLLTWSPLHAQYFGRNKVQYRAFDFQIIRTRHFDVHYYPAERAAALDAARMVERAYARLSRVLQHEFRERKPLIVYASHGDFQQTNVLPDFLDEGTGGVTEALKDRMILPFTGSYAHFDHVLTHELVHAFQYDIIFRRGIMSDASPMMRIPLWFMEGMAEYLSVGEVDALTHAWLRDAVFAGYLRSIREMSERDDYLSYRFGQSLWAHIAAKWGDEVVGILLQKAPRVGIERAFATTLGLPLDGLSQEWTAAVRQRYLPQLAVAQQPVRMARKLTAHERADDPWFLAPAISPDGGSMVFLSQRDGFFFDLWLADAVTGRIERRLIESARNADFESLRFMSSGASFSPDGRHLAFAAQTGGQDALYIYDLQDHRVARKLRFAMNGIESPSWSPDGRRIVFSGLDGGLSDLYITDLDGNLERLTHDRHADVLPAWSPDGSTIAFSTDRGADADFDRLYYGNLRVALLHLDTRALEILPFQDSGRNTNPVWSPDGQSIAWVSDRSGTNDLYLFERDAGELHRITGLLSGIIGITPLSPVLSWSRSGRLLFVYFEQAGYNIYALDDPRALPRTRITTPVIAANAESQEQSLAAAPPITETPPRRASGRGVFEGSFYRSAGGFRASAEATQAASTERPMSVVALLDSATLALPDTSTFEFRDYRVKFSPDMIGRPTVGAQVGGHYGNGLYGGSYIALSDMLGNHHIVAAANLNGTVADASFLAGYSFLRTRANYTASVAQYPQYRYLGTTLRPLDIDNQTYDAIVNVFLRDVIRGGQLSVSYPLSTFRRIEFGAHAAWYSREVIYIGRDRVSGKPLEKTEDAGNFGYIQPTAALVFDNSLFGWTGPIAGRRYRLQASRAIGDLAFAEGLLDLRNYWNWSRRAVIAARIVALTRFGRDADRFSLYWGGPYFVRGYDGSSFDLEGSECTSSRRHNGESASRCPVRDQLIGSSAAFANLELRVPVIRELQIGFLGTFPPIDAVAFFDGGLAWDREVCHAFEPARAHTCAAARPVHVVWRRDAGQDPYLWREPVFSYGAGLRINIFYTVVRLDYAFPLNRPRSRGLFSLSFGPSF